MTDEEKFIRKALADLQADYRRVAQPYLDRLVQIAVRTPPTMHIRLDDKGRIAFDVVDVSGNEPNHYRDDIPESKP